jgi:hypothetical protein
MAPKAITYSTTSARRILLYFFGDLIRALPRSGAAKSFCPHCFARMPVRGARRTNDGGGRWDVSSLIARLGK